MVIISRKMLRGFASVHHEAKGPLDTWWRIALNADWANLAQLKQAFPSADQVGNFVVFNLGGNKFRLIVRVVFAIRTIYIRHVLTHAAYDRENWKNDPWY